MRWTLKGPQTAIKSSSYKRSIFFITCSYACVRYHSTKTGDDNFTRKNIKNRKLTSSFDKLICFNAMFLQRKLLHPFLFLQHKLNLQSWQTALVSYWSVVHVRLDSFQLVTKNIGSFWNLNPTKLCEAKESNVEAFFNKNHQWI